MRIPVRQHIPALDGIRGLAVAMVVAFHLFGRGEHARSSGNALIRAFAAINSLGWTGVSLFFVLSGFLITGILWDTREDNRRLRNFYARRTLRIFPLYYGTLLAIVLLAAWQGTLGDTMHFLWTYLLYLQNQLPVAHTSYPISAVLKTYHFWSLAVEEQFYLVWPFLVYRMRTLKQLKWMCLLTFVASAAFRVLYGWNASDLILWEGSLAVYAGSLALGAYLACCYRGDTWSRLLSAAPWVMPVALVGYVASIQLPSDPVTALRVRMIFGLLVMSLFWGALLVTTFRGGLIQRTFEMGWLRFLGKISYGLYVFHVLFIGLFIKLSVALAPHSQLGQHLLTGAVGVPVSVLVAWLSFRFFESPFYKLKRRFHSATAPSRELNSSDTKESAIVA